MAGKTKSQKAAANFANLYVRGPEGIQGDWEACEKAIGKSFDIDDPEVRDAIIKEGGHPESVPPIPDAPILNELPLQLEKADSVPDGWRKLADSLSGVVEAIAKGEVKATAAQTAIVKHVLDRGYGRVTASTQEKLVPAGLLVLPTLGERANMVMCPNCSMKYRVEKEEKNENNRS
jgi:hypothetical protein